MKKSPMEIMWEELKIYFYKEHISEWDIAELWAKYQIETMHSFGEEK